MFEKEELELIVPHKGKMLLLTRINEYNLEERTLCAEYHITEDCLFYDPVIGGVPAWAGFEFMAQAIAALSGIYSRQKKEKAKIGFILSISSMRTELPSFKAGTTAEIRVRESSSLEQISNFEGKIFLEGSKVMEGNLMVMEAKEKQIRSMIKERIQHS